MTGCSEAALVLVGDELLDGRTMDRNLSAISRELGSRGIRIVESRTVPDNVDAVAQAVLTLSSPGRLIITTGGLGPTDDDLTLEGIAAAATLPLVSDPDACIMIRDCYAGSGIDMPRSALSQARIPSGAIPVANSAGIAPGVVLETESLSIISLPGVPGEVQVLLPVCLRTAGLEKGLCDRPTVIRTWGIPENRLFDMLSPMATELGTSLAFLPCTGRVDVRISGDAAEDFKRAALELLNEAVYGFNPDISLEETVAALLLDRRWTLAVAESCTGGMLGAALTKVPGSSQWFSGGVISYSNEAKTGLLGVSAGTLREQGAVSSQVVQEMARGVSERFSSDIAVAISGIAGPGGGSDDKPVGTVWIAVQAAEASGVSEYRFPGGREEVRRAAVSCSLGMLCTLLRREN